MNRLKQLSPVYLIFNDFLRRNPLAIWGFLLAFVATIAELLAVFSIGLYLSENSIAIDAQKESVLLIVKKIILRLSIPDFIVLLSVILTVRLLGTFLSNFIVFKSSKRFYHYLGSTTFGHLVRRVPLLQLTAGSIGSYVTLAGDQTARVSRVVTTIGLSVTPIALCLIYVAAMFFINGRATFYFFFFVTVYALVSTPILRKLKHLGFKSDQLSKEVNSTFVEAINSVPSIRSLGLTGVIEARYSDFLFRYLSYLRDIEVIQSLSKLLPIFVIVIGFGIAAIVTPSVYGVTRHDLVGVFALIFSVMRILPSLGQLYGMAQVVSSDLGACREVSEFVGYSDSKTRGDHSKIQPPKSTVFYENVGELNLSLTLTGVSFKFAGRDRSVFDDISFKFESGLVYAIVGPTGSGKSSLGLLMSGLIDPNRGTINLEDQNGHSYDLNGSIVLVNQTPFVFRESIDYNLSFGSKVDSIKVLETLSAVCLADVVRDKPGGLSHLLEYQGSNLSGGQRQRLSLGRALLKSPLGLILDETTSGLDSDTKTIVFNNLKKIFAKKILIMISHDAEIVRKCDRVIMIDGHCGIKEIGRDDLASNQLDQCFSL